MAALQKFERFSREHLGRYDIRSSVFVARTLCTNELASDTGILATWGNLFYFLHVTEAGFMKPCALLKLHFLTSAGNKCIRWSASPASVRRKGFVKPLAYISGSGLRLGAWLGFRTSRLWLRCNMCSPLRWLVWLLHRRLLRRLWTTH